MKHILNTLAFYARYTDEKEKGWHSFNRHSRCTMRAIKSLEKRGFLKVDYEINMACFTGKTH